VVTGATFGRPARQPDWTSAIAQDIARAARDAAWITPADDAAVKSAIALAVRYEGGHPECANSLLNALSLLGLTPVGRQRVKVPAEATDDTVANWNSRARRVGGAEDLDATAG
jgi:hypothetical protein